VKVYFATPVKMDYIFVLLLMAACLIFITNCEIYWVIPDDHYSATNNETLQHYLNNSNKYFTSDTQLVFLPGKHHLVTDLVIHNVFNLTLSGIEEMDDAIIYCTRSAYIFINSSDYITIGSLRVTECGVSQGKDLLATLDTLVIYNCSNILILDSLFVCQYQQCGIVIANSVGESLLKNITSSYLLITHNMTRSHSSMVIANYHHYMGHFSYKHRAIAILFHEHSQQVDILLFQIKLSMDKAMTILSSTKTGANMVYINKLELTDTSVTENLIEIKITKASTLDSEMKANLIYFEDCSFSRISGNRSLGLILKIIDYNGFALSHIFMVHCRFSNINSSVIIRTFAQKAVSDPTLLLNIRNTSFLLHKDATCVLWVENTNLLLMGPVIFTKIKHHVAIIISAKSKIEVSDGIITFSLNQADYCIVIEYIVLGGLNSKLAIIANNFSVVFYANNYHDRNSVLCLFQYEMRNISTGIIITSEPQHHQHNYSIVLQDNIGDVVTNKRFSMSHCDWMEESFFAESDPFEVNKQIIHYINNSMTVKLSVPNTICYCTDNQHYNCSIDDLGPIYPGQTFSLGILINSYKFKNKFQINIDNNRKRACRSHSVKDHMFLIPGICTKIKYKGILYKSGNSCSIFLNAIGRKHATNTPYGFVDVYRIKIASCPLGFALNKVLQICLCDQY